MRLSPSMRRVLTNLRDGKTPATGAIPRYFGRSAGRRTAAHYGGLTKTLQSLRQRGLIEELETDKEYVWRLTEAGREACKKLPDK